MTEKKKMLINLHFISIDDLNVDEMFMIRLAFWFRLNVDQFRLICQIQQQFFYQNSLLYG